MSSFLYGYRLQFRKFPYLEGGPSTITPLILAVLCLISSERFAIHQHYRGPLIDEVQALLASSPAESWQTFEGDQSKGFGDIEADDPLDAEFGLGPEEIVAACVLATYMTDRREGALIARFAFRWARGWIKVSGRFVALTCPNLMEEFQLLSSTPPRVTLAETAGFVPPERKATDQDMARVWLLCYASLISLSIMRPLTNIFFFFLQIVDSTERLQFTDIPAPLSRDALSYCNLLIPPSTTYQSPFFSSHSPPRPEDAPDPHDILLTSHARLVTILNEWRHRVEQIDVPNADRKVYVAQLKRLAGKVNGELEWWNAGYQAAKPSDVKSNNGEAGVGEGKGLSWRYTEMTWLFIKMLVNSTMAKALSPSPTVAPHTQPLVPSIASSSASHNSSTLSSSDSKLREASIALVVDCALEILEMCARWAPKEEIINFGPTYLYFITVAGNELVSALDDGGGEGVISIDERKFHIFLTFYGKGILLTATSDNLV